MTKALPTQVHVISHTHWDREWYLTREVYRLRLIDLIDGVLDRMDREPEFTFFHLDGQTIVLEDYLEVRPDQKERLRQRITEGRLLVGPWYVMPDMFLVSGEALVRNLAMGHRISESFGKVMRAGYTPDPFGHVAQMPQILAGFGLDNAVLWRGFGGPKAEYIWEGLDGTRTLLLHLPREGYCNAFRLPLLPDATRAASAAAVVDGEASRSSVSSVLLMAGVDHTEPHPKLMKLIEEIGAAEGITATLSTLPAYVASVRDAVMKSELALEVVRGELRSGEDYSNLLPGVISARTYLKKSNVRAQAMLEKVAEPLALFAWLAGEPHPTGILNYAWKTLIENHPHDSICGCSIDEVHNENDTRFGRVLQATDGQIKRSLRALARRIAPAEEGSFRVVLVNTDIHPFSGVVSVALDVPVESAEAGRILDSDLFDAPLAFFPCGAAIQSITDPDGRPIRFQEIGREKRIEQLTSRVEVPLAVHVERIQLACDVALPSAGFAVFDVKIDDRRKATEMEHAGESSIENDLLRLDVNHDGTVNLLDKRTGSTYAHMLEIEDVGDVGDEYTYSPPAQDRVFSSRDGSKATVFVVTRGELRSTVRIAMSIALPASASVDRQSRDDELVMTDVKFDLSLNHGSPVVDGVVRINNRAADHRFRLLFPTGASTVTESRADTAFGVLTRPAKRAPLRQASPEAPVDSYPMQSFVDAGDSSAGITVLSEGLMEFEVLGGEPGHQAVIALTLIRSVGWLSREDLATRKGNAGPSLATPGAQCIGRHEFRFAFAPRQTPPSEAHLCAISRAFLAPPSVVIGTNGPIDGSPLGRRHSFLDVVCAPHRGAVVSALKKADDRDSMVIRLLNPGSSEVDVSLRGERPVTAAYGANLREQRHTLIASKGGAVAVTLGSRKIATLDIET